MKTDEINSIDERLVKIAYLKPWDQDLMKTLLSILNSTRKAQFGSVFNKPVDYLGMGLVDYIDIIPKPMDITTVVKKLTNGSYEYLFQLFRDVHLIFENSREFNGQDHKYYEYANATETSFINQISDHLGGISENDFILLVETKFPENPPQTVIGTKMSKEEIKSFVTFLSKLPTFMQIEVRSLSALLLDKSINTISVADLIEKPLIARKIWSYAARKMMELDNLK